MFYENIQPRVLSDFLQNPTHSTLKELLNQNTGETDFLDFKMKWIDFTKLAKHILAIANSGGGCIIIGISHRADGLCFIDGVSDEDFLDKADIDNKLEHILPKWLKFRTEDFLFPRTIEEEQLKGKKLQVLIIEYDPKYVPYTSIISRGELRYGAIYIRQGTKSIEANHDKLVEMIIRKVQAGGSESTDMALQDHLIQLKHLLYERKKNGNEDYDAYLNDIIYRKKKRIEKILDIENIR